MTAYDLPTSLIIGGVEHPIRTGWRAIMDIFAVLSDPDFDEEMKTVGFLKIFYPQWRTIPAEHIQEALEKACDFIDCGHKQGRKGSKKTLDWEQDAPLVINAVNSVAGMEIRRNPDIHWWTFWGWFMSSEDNLLSTVIHIRRKKATGKNLEKWEKEFYTENKELVDLKKRYTREELEEIESLKKWIK